MDQLTRVFQSNNGEIRLKLLRLFLENKKTIFNIEEIENTIKAKRDLIRKDLTNLFNIGFLDKYIDTKSVSSYKLNINFGYIDSLYDLVFDFKSIDKNIILARLKKVGRLKLLTFTGIFIDREDIDLDILVVGDNLKQKEIEKILTEFKALFTSKLKISIIDIEEFDYRKKMFDRFLHIILDSNRITLLDKVSDRVL